MDQNAYAMMRSLENMDYETAVAKITDALAEEGFGVLTEIDVKATLKKKIDVDFQRYVILGACNPKQAFRALSAERFIGLLLPCNVVVAENEGGGATVAILRPTGVFGLIDNEDVKPLATAVEGSLCRALDSL